jgi:serine phosphatase RsbU (regulator of sigma subunit)
VIAASTSEVRTDSEAASVSGADELARRLLVAEYAARVSDALAGTLNQRRTLGRACALAVPELGVWAAVSVIDGAAVRQVTGRSSGRAAETSLTGAAAGEIMAVLSALPPGGSILGLDDVRALEAVLVEPGLRSALAELGATHVLRVLMRAHGSTVGVLHVAGAADQLDVPRALELAHRAAVALAAARVYEERAALAETLRAALLPPALPTIPGVEVGARYRAALETTEIGGDFYEVSPLGDGRWTISLGDVCGKGVEAAVLTGQVRQSLRTAVLANSDPPATLSLLNAAMLATDGSRFVTLLHGLMRACEGGLHVRLACGGHPPPLVLRSDGRVEVISVSGTLVGMLHGVTFGTSDTSLAPGETLLLYTDGITEARVGNEMLGPERLIEMFADCRGMPAQSVTERVEQFVLEFLDGRPHDDLAIVAVRPTGRLS